MGTWMMTSTGKIELRLIPAATGYQRRAPDPTSWIRPHAPRGQHISCHPLGIPSTRQEGERRAQ